MSKTRAAKIHAILVYTWCALVIPTVFWWKSTTWLVFMAFSAFALVLVNNFQILNIVREVVDEKKGPLDAKQESQ